MQRRTYLIKALAAMTLIVGLSSTLGFAPATHPPHDYGAGHTRKRQTINLAICLDTSNSMDGLIDAAKQQLWDIVNELSRAEPMPDLRVALLSYGNDGYNQETGWVRLETDFTEDLDYVSEKLFALTTNGGTEYVGRVLQGAFKQLSWSRSSDALELVVVAGNESADQDPILSNVRVCHMLRNHGIIVNAIYCGSATDNIAPSWRRVANLANGHFSAIDQQHGTIVVETPFDQKLVDLSTKLNTTYLPFGAYGQKGLHNQSVQDENASSLNRATAASRAVSKAGGNYRNSGWDLVDACREKALELDSIDKMDLPEVMRGMTLKECRVYISLMQHKREVIQLEIKELTKKRRAYITAEIARQKLDQSKSFGFALMKAIRAQAVRKGFVFKDHSH